jgi:hypothetical protein
MSCKLSAIAQIVGIAGCHPTSVQQNITAVRQSQQFGRACCDFYSVWFEGARQLKNFTEKILGFLIKSSHCQDIFTGSVKLGDRETENCVGSGITTSRDRANRRTANF